MKDRVSASGSTRYRGDLGEKWGRSRGMGRYGGGTFFCASGSTMRSSCALLVMGDSIALKFLDQGISSWSAMVPVATSGLASTQGQGQG